MKTLEEFEQFYRTTLVDELKPIEALRKKTFSRLLVVTLILFGLMTAVFYLASHFGWDYPVLIGAVVVFSFLVGLVLYFLPGKYVGEFKSIAVSRIVGFVNENITYDPDGCIPIQPLSHRKLFCP